MVSMENTQTPATAKASDIEVGDKIDHFGRIATVRRIEVDGDEYSITGAFDDSGRYAGFHVLAHHELVTV